MSSPDDHIVHECIQKMVQIIVQSRVRLGKVDGKHNKLFNLGLFEAKHIRDAVSYEMGQHKLHTQLQVDIAIRSPSLKNDVLLERWVLHCAVLRSSSSKKVDRANMYKRMIVLVRSLFSQSRFLPAYDLVKGLKSSHFMAVEAPQPSFQLYHRVTAAQATFSPQETLIFDTPPANFVFTPVMSNSGKLHLSVFYRKDCSFSFVPKGPSAVMATGDNATLIQEHYIPRPDSAGRRRSSLERRMSTPGGGSMGHSGHRHHGGSGGSSSGAPPKHPNMMERRNTLAHIPSAHTHTYTGRSGRSSPQAIPGMKNSHFMRQQQQQPQHPHSYGGRLPEHRSHGNTPQHGSLGSSHSGTSSPVPLGHGTGSSSNSNSNSNSSSGGATRIRARSRSDQADYSQGSQYPQHSHSLPSDARKWGPSGADRAGTPPNMSSQYREQLLLSDYPAASGTGPFAHASDRQSRVQELYGSQQAQSLPSTWSQPQYHSSTPLQQRIAQHPQYNYRAGTDPHRRASSMSSPYMSPASSTVVSPGGSSPQMVLGYHHSPVATGGSPHALMPPSLNSSPVMTATSSSPSAAPSAKAAAAALPPPQLHSPNVTPQPPQRTMSAAMDSPQPPFNRVVSAPAAMQSPNTTQYTQMGYRRGGGTPTQRDDYSPSQQQQQQHSYGASSRRSPASFDSQQRRPTGSSPITIPSGSSYGAYYQSPPPFAYSHSHSAGGSHSHRSVPFTLGTQKYSPPRLHGDNAHTDYSGKGTPSAHPSQYSPSPSPFGTPKNELSYGVSVDTASPDFTRRGSERETIPEEVFQVSGLTLTDAEEPDFANPLNPNAEDEDVEAVVGAFIRTLNNAPPLSTAALTREAVDSFKSNLDALSTFYHREVATVQHAGATGDGDASDDNGQDDVVSANRRDHEDDMSDAPALNSGLAQHHLTEQKGGF